LVLVVVLVATACTGGGSDRAAETPAPVPSCPAVSPWPASKSPYSNYADFLVHDHVVYASYGVLRSPPPVATPLAVGPLVMRIRCRLATLLSTGEVGDPAQVEGAAAYLPVGTPVHAVRGFDPACRLVSIVDGRTTLYLAQREEPDGQSVTAPCAVRQTQSRS
jgi:hypothetical protein